MSDHYAVIGNPIAHSLSPEIHSLFAQQTKQNMYYTRLMATPQNFISVVRQFQRRGGKGLNVTAPLKKQILQLVQHNSQRANLAQAVNTLIFNPGSSIIGDNTDGIGLIRDITREPAFHPNKKRILIMGVGGAVSGILEELLRQQPASITLATRILSKADTLIEQFQSMGELNTYQLDGSIDINHYDLIINATPVDWQKEPLLPLQDNELASIACYDLSYAPANTSFLTWAKQHGCQHTRNGLGMLIEQAAESFYIWRGVRPDVEPVRSLYNQSY